MPVFLRVLFPFIGLSFCSAAGAQEALDICSPVYNQQYFLSEMPHIHAPGLFIVRGELVDFKANKLLPEVEIEVKGQQKALIRSLQYGGEYMLIFKKASLSFPLQLNFSKMRYEDFQLDIASPTSDQITLDVYLKPRHAVVHRRKLKKDAYLSSPFNVNVYSLE